MVRVFDYSPCNKPEAYFYLVRESNGDYTIYSNDRAMLIPIRDVQRLRDSLTKHLEAEERIAYYGNHEHEERAIDGRLERHLPR